VIPHPSPNSTVVLVGEDPAGAQAWARQLGQAFLIEAGLHGLAVFDASPWHFAASENTPALRTLHSEALLTLLIPSVEPKAHPKSVLRQRLLDWGVAFSVVSAPSRQPMPTVLRQVRAQQIRASTASQAPTPWRHLCHRCGDPGCERLLFPALNPVVNNQQEWAAWNSNPLRSDCDNS